jgi:hypothetical protein
MLFSVEYQGKDKQPWKDTILAAMQVQSIAVFV